MPQEMRNQIEAALVALGRYEFGQEVTVIARAERLAARCAGQALLEEQWRNGLLRLLRSESPGAGQAAAKLLSFVGAGPASEALQRMLGETDARQVEIARLALASTQRVRAMRPEAPVGYRALFDGESLDGWVVDTPAVWSVRNGILIGSSPGLKYNEFLRTRGEYMDFHLHVKLKLIRGVGNTGVQFRSGPAAAAHEVVGYQADGGERFWGRFTTNREGRRFWLRRAGRLSTSWTRLRGTATTSSPRGLRFPSGWMARRRCVMSRVTRQLRRRVGLSHCRYIRIRARLRCGSGIFGYGKGRQWAARMVFRPMDRLVFDERAAGVRHSGHGIRGIRESCW